MLSRTHAIRGKESRTVLKNIRKSILYTVLLYENFLKALLLTHYPYSLG